jgi:hypothetical protein
MVVLVVVLLKNMSVLQLQVLELLEKVIMVEEGQHQQTMVQVVVVVLEQLVQQHLDLELVEMVEMDYLQV